MSRQQSAAGAGSGSVAAAGAKAAGAPIIDLMRVRELVAVVADPDAADRARLAAITASAAQVSGRNVAIAEAADGVQCERLLEEKQPHIVVTEALLEGQSGLALLRRLPRLKLPHRPAWLFVTHLSTETDRYWALRLGAQAFVRKPYEDGQLLTRITRMLQHGINGAERPI